MASEAQPTLFDAPAPPAALGLHRDGKCFAWTCPGCDGAVYSETYEDEIACINDPWCCFCRAAFMGLTFHEWRLLPDDQKHSVAVPGGYRRTRGSQS